MYQENKAKRYESLKGSGRKECFDRVGGDKTGLKEGMIKIYYGYVCDWQN